MTKEKENTENLKKQNEEYQKRLTLLEKATNLQSDSFDQSVLMVESLKETLGITSKLNQFDTTLLGLNKKINKEILNQRISLSDIKSIDKQILKNADLINKSKTLQKSLQKDIKDEVTKEGKSMANAVGNAKANLTLIQEKNDKLKSGESLSQKTRESIEKEIAKRENTLKQQISSLSTAGQQLLFAEKNTKELKKQTDERIKERAIAEKIQKSLGVAGGLTKLLGSIPGIGGVASEALSEVTEELEEAADNSEKIPNRLQTMGKVLGKVGKGIMHNLTDPMVIGVALVTAFTKALVDVDKHTGETAKNLGVSYKETLALRNEANTVALLHGDILVNSKEIIEAQSKLNKHFGSSVKFSMEMAANFSSIQKRTQLSDESMGLFAQMALKSDKTIKNILKDTHKVVLEQNQQNKLAFSVKDVQEGIAKTSKSLQLTYKLSTKELANSVIEAKKLGVELADVEAIAGHILDFESSIQSELQAELLLGKEINLEKARLFALEGKMGEVAKEVLKNKAIMNAFDTKNVIAQEAAAKALGMSREQLANMVMEQKELALLQGKLGNGIENMAEAQKKYNEKRAAGMSAEAASKLIGDESLSNQLETVSAAERFEATITRVQEVFVAMATPVLEFIDFLTTGEDSAKRLARIFVGIAGTMLTIKLAMAAAKLSQAAMLPKLIAELALRKGTAAAALTTSGAMTGGLSVVATIAAVVAGMATLGSMFMMKEGGIVTKPTMAMIGEAGTEMVLPIEKAGEMGFGGQSPENDRRMQQQLQESKTQNQLLSQLIGNTNKLKDLDNVSFYEIQ